MVPEFDGVPHPGGAAPAVATSTPAAATPDANTIMAQYRTELALQRTHLSWVRTAFTFITAAVAIQRTVALDALGTGVVLDDWDARVSWACVAVCGLTIFLLLAASGQFWRQRRRISAMTGLPPGGFMPSLVLTVLVSAVGLLAAAFLISVI